MNLTKQFFDVAYKYQEDRAAARERYKARMNEIKATKGSPFYDVESKKARSEMDDRLARLREYAGEDLNICINDMRKANSRRPMHAPTPEQASIIQLMKLKNSVTREDLDAAANSCKDSNLCLAILDEIAREKGVIGFSAVSFSDKTDLSSDTVSKVLDNLADWCNDFLQSDRALAARIVARNREQHYGDSKDELELNERPRFDSEETCFEKIANISSDVLTGLQNAVNS